MMDGAFSMSGRVEILSLRDNRAMCLGTVSTVLSQRSSKGPPRVQLISVGWAFSHLPHRPHPFYSLKKNKTENMHAA
jgi:hypothetical protein